MTDAPGHLDLDALADVLAGERDDAHLRACRPCSDRLAELAAADASVAAALAALPPPALPDELSARLMSALSQEEHADVATVRPLRPRTAGWLPSVAASVALVLAGAVGWSLLGQGGPRSADTAGDAGGGGGQESATAPEAAAGLAAAGPSSATDWAEEAARPAALSRLLDGAADARRLSAAPAADAALDRLRDPAALAACLGALPGGDGDVLAVDYARYAGAPAVAVVQAAGAGSVEVTVVSSSCSATDPALLDEVVLPRP